MTAKQIYHELIPRRHAVLPVDTVCGWFELLDAIHILSYGSRRRYLIPRRLTSMPVLTAPFRLIEVGCISFNEGMVHTSLSIANLNNKRHAGSSAYGGAVSPLSSLLYTVDRWFRHSAKNLPDDSREAIKAAVAELRYSIPGVIEGAS